MNVPRRAQAMLADPAAAWTAIAGETDDPAYVLSRYVTVLAVIPALFSFLGASAIGVVAPGGGTLRASLFNGLFGAIFGYVMACATVLVVAVVINVLAPLFGGRRSFDSAFKLAAYSFTPVWLAGIFLAMPGLRFLTLTGFYGAYLLWLGLPRLTKTPAQASLFFTLSIAACAAALIYGAALAQHLVFGTPGL